MLKAVAADLTIKPDTIETLLYGKNPMPGVVSVEVDGDGNVVLFQRGPAGVRRLVARARYRHFFLLSDDCHLAGHDGVTDIQCLSGDGHFRYACYYHNRRSMWRAVNDVVGNYNRANGTEHPPNDWWRIPDILLITDSEVQFLMSSGIGQFRGMEFSDLRRMQIAIDADMPFEPEHTSPVDKRIVLRRIALTDSSVWSRIIDSEEMSEKEMLQQLIDLIGERDPDVIEGHGIFEAIIPILRVKCARHHISFRAGRGRKAVESYSTTRMKNDKSVPYTNYVVTGRHVIDTLFLSEKSAPECLLDCDARDVAAVASAVCGESARAESDDVLSRAAATARISDALLPAEFFQAQMVPIPLGKLCMTGSAKKIDYLMIRAYLSAGHSIPKPPKPETFEGGFCEQFIAGRCENVVKIDVESQYPSLMIGEDIKPEPDSLDVFQPMLKKLTWLRLEAKMKRDSTSGPQRDRHDHLQRALKLLINSFYGYLGYRYAYFADFSAAARVTALGRAVMKKMIETLEGVGCNLIQCDTDGAFFTPPFDSAADCERLAGIVEAVEKSLPQYLEIAVEGVWPAMLSLRKKNYALLNCDGAVSITGGILKSSADERFVRRALATAAECILKNDLPGLHTYISSLREDVSEGQISFPDVCLTETIRMNDVEYREHIAGGSGRKPVYEAMLKYKKNKGERIFPVGWDVGYYHRDDQGQPGNLPAFSFEFDPERPDYDRSHYRNRLARALRRLQTLLTPEQYEILFEKFLSETALRAAKKIPAGAAVVVKKTSGGLDRYIELSTGYKKGKGIKRNVFVKADDTDSVREFREKYSDMDVYRSTYEYLCDRTPEKGATRFCPKRGDLVIELECETGEHPENVAGALEAARHCAEVIERILAIRRDAVSYFYNGGKSFYLTISQQSLGLPDSVELNAIYDCIARHVRDNMVEEHRGAVDMNIYNHDRPLRIPGTTHPKHGLYNTRLATEEFFNLDPDKIIRLARLSRETVTGELRFEDSAETHTIIHELTKDIPRTEYFDPTRKPLRINMERRNWHAKTINYLRDRGVPVRIPCAETLTALIHSGGHTGFDGRVKLVTELRDAGESEEEIIRIFADSPYFHEKYFNDIVRTDTRPGDERNGTGYMIRPDIWNDYSGIGCDKCQEWCSPDECYRNTKIAFFNDVISPNPVEFRDASREALRAALTEIMYGLNIESPSDYRINLIEAPMASGKTYQAVSMALELASKDMRSLILAPDHTVCAEAVGMADGMAKPGGGTLVHLVGKNENSCADIATMVGPCSSCRCGVKAVQKKAPEFVEKLLSSLNGIYSLFRMKDMLAEINKEPGAAKLCLRTLSMLIAPRASIIVSPFIFLIDRNLSDILGELPNHIFIDEGDMFADHLADYCRRSLTVALPRVTNYDCIHSCRKPRCSHCKLSYSSTIAGGDMEPRARASESATFGAPVDFINALDDALHTVRQEIARGVVRRDIFDLEAVERNIGNLRALLKPKSHYLYAGETDITVEEHLRRENAALVESSGASHEVVETGPVFGSEGEITKFPFVKLEKTLSEPDGIQYDEEPPDRDSFPVFRFSVSSIYADRDSYAYYKDGDPAYRNGIIIFLKFAEFCENAPGGALLRHVPRCGVTETACKIVLSYMDGGHFDDLMFLLMMRNTALMSGTFMKLRMAAAALLLKESQIRFYQAPVKMHNKCTLVLHNNILGNVYLAGDVRDNPAKPKVLNFDSLFKFFNYCIGLLGDGIHLYYFGKNKNAARALYDAYKRYGGRLSFKANLVNSNGDIVFSGEDEPLFQANATEETRKHLGRTSRMFLDNYRSTRSRGKNLPDFHLSIADGNGRANFDHFFDYVAAINRSTWQKITMGELLNYNRSRAVCQAMLRTPRDDARKHLILYNGDMSLFDVPDYLRNRVILAEDIYRDNFEGARKEKFPKLIERFNPESHDAAQMLALAGYFEEMVNGETGCHEDVSAIPDKAQEQSAPAHYSECIRNAALLSPAYSERAVNKILSAISEKGSVSQVEDRVGRNTQWLAMLVHLVNSGLLDRSKSGRSNIFVPAESWRLQLVPESGGNPNE